MGTRFSAKLGFMRYLPVAVAMLFASPALADQPKPIEIPESVAKTEAEMKPYAELIEHTEEKFELVPIKGGRFVMGSPATEKGARRMRVRSTRSRSSRSG